MPSDVRVSMSDPAAPAARKPRRLPRLPTVLGAVALVSVAALAADFMLGDTIPGYVHRTGSGSIVDVRADGTHNGSAWTVVFTRSLATGDAAHDIEFVPGMDHYFQVARFDNAGGADHTISQAGVSFTLSVPLSPGALTFSATPSQLTSLSGQYLASGQITITATWPDVTRNDRRAEWAFDGAEWTQAADEEDRLAIIWDLQGDHFASSGTCALMCHSPLKYTAPGSKVDAWHWKATRTNPAGFADDQWWDDGELGTVSGRHNDTGTAPYRSNKSGSLPASMGVDGNGTGSKYLFDGIDGMREAAAFDALGIWNSGDVLSGYVNRLGSGSIVDVPTTATHDGTGWTVTFKRKLATGETAGDMLFAAGGTYHYQVATWDNAGGIDHDMTQAGTVQSMTLPASPGPIMFAATPAQLSSVSGALLDSGEISVTMSWADATRDDIRNQWNYNGSAWSQLANNEDRLSVIWDLAGDSFVSSGTCTMMCHSSKMYTEPGTRVDEWFWKAARTAPAGFSDDKFWDDGNLGTVSGRRNDPGTSVTEDNSNVGGLPSYMSTAGAGVSAAYLFEHAPAAGWSLAVDYDPGIVLPTLVVTKSTLKLSFKKPLSDSMVIGGTFDKLLPPTLGEGVTGTFQVGNYSKAFTMGAKTSSLKDPNIKVAITPKSGKWSATIKKVDLAALLGIIDETILKPGITLDLDWSLTLDTDWGLQGTTALNYKSTLGKSGSGKLIKP